MKTSYHPAITVAFYLKCLPQEIIRYIPASTQFDWKQKESASRFGYDWYRTNEHLFQTLQHISNNKRLLRINRALIRIIGIAVFIKKYSGCLQQGLVAVPQTIVGNIGKVTPVYGLTKTLRMLQLPYGSWLKLKKSSRCKASVLRLCRVKHPGQLLQKEITAIEKYCKDAQYIHWPLSSIYHQVKRDGSAFFHISTFYKYVSLLGLKRHIPSRRNKNHHVGIRAENPLDILHADVTVLRTVDNSKSYIFLVQDNYSRAILRYAVSQYCCAQTTFDNLRQVYEQYLQPAGREHCRLITDDGPENMGPVKNFITACEQPAIQHLIAQKDIEFSNSMIEAANKQLKYRFLFHYPIADYTALLSYVQQAARDFNERPNHVLHGFTPLEVLNGCRPDAHYYGGQTQKAKTNRIVENKRIKCCFYSF